MDPRPASSPTRVSTAWRRRPRRWWRPPTSRPRLAMCRIGPEPLTTTGRQGIGLPRGYSSSAGDWRQQRHRVQPPLPLLACCTPEPLHLSPTTANWQALALVPGGADSWHDGTAFTNPSFYAFPNGGRQRTCRPVTKMTDPLPRTTCPATSNRGALRERAARLLDWHEPATRQQAHRRGLRKQLAGALHRPHTLAPRLPPAALQ
jgi:hypothetical protein